MISAAVYRPRITSLYTRASAEQSKPGLPAAPDRAALVDHEPHGLTNRKALKQIVLDTACGALVGGGIGYLGSVAHMMGMMGSSGMGTAISAGILVAGGVYGYHKYGMMFEMKLENKVLGRALGTVMGAGMAGMMGLMMPMNPMMNTLNGAGMGAMVGAMAN